MNGAIMIRWGASIPGREATGMDFFGRTVNHFEQLAKQGRIHGHREFFSITGRGMGVMFIDGEIEELTKIVYETDMLKLTAQASAFVEDLDIQLFVGGTDQAIQDLMAKTTASMKEIGVM